MARDPIKIEIVSDEEAEEADFVVCMTKETATPFTDNEFGACSRCNCAIQFRPHVPKRPPKICLECAMLESRPDN